MSVAHGDDCSDFPQPSEPFQASPFFGKYASTGRSGSYYNGTPSTGDTYNETGDDNGTGGTGQQEYDPRLYESPPQQAPEVQQPPGQGNAPVNPGNGNQGEGGGATPNGQ
jgi:hypothetical protein